MVKRPTIFESRYGKPPGIEQVLQIWNDDLIDNLLSAVWKGYDLLYSTFLSQIPWHLQHEDLERSITQIFEKAIRDVMNPYMPCYIQHGPFERASRAGGNAQPPTYDLAFILINDIRIMWPLEAKVIKNDKNTGENLKDYIDTLNNRFITCYYAPFSSSAAMVGYLIAGEPDNVLENISSRIKDGLKSYSQFSLRNHKVSEHLRNVPHDQEDYYPKEFRCHHMIMRMKK
jgi:hypothetical protein